MTGSPPLQPATAPLQPPPVVLNGRYELGPLIAMGGMAQVFRGLDRLLDRPVAIKILRPHYAASPELRDRFRREARLAASLTHVHLVNIYDVGQDGERYYMVMELLPGRTLKDLVEAGPLPLPAAVSFARQVALGMAYAHQRGLIHRDLKPQNVLITEDGQAKVADFGLAMRSEAAQLTQPGTVWGTVQYLSPEQAQGGVAGPRSDIYALGAMFYELLTGRPPYEADTPAAIMMKHVYDPPPSPRAVNPTLPAAVDRLLQQALAKDPAERFPSMEALAAALADLLTSADARTMVWPSIPGQAGAALTQDRRAGDGLRPPVASPPGRVGPAEATRYTRPAAPPPSPAAPARRSRLPLAVAGTVLAFFALMAVGAALAGQATGIGILPVRATATARLSPTPVPSPTPTPIPTVVVPDVVNQPQGRARERLRAMGLDVEVAEEFSREVRADNVISQEPGANTTLEQGKKVKLTVSKGPLRGPVPRVIGKTNGAAVEQLVGAGFVAKTAEEFHDQVAAGVVFGQDPPPERPADLGSEVTIRVSKGKEQVAIPVVRGKTEAEARQALQDAGFQVTVSYDANSGVAPEQVFAVDPPEGWREVKGSPVQIRVRRDPSPTAIPATATARPTQGPNGTPTAATTPGRGPTPRPNGTPRPGAVPTARS